MCGNLFFFSEMVVTRSIGIQGDNSMQLSMRH